MNDDPTYLELFGRLDGITEALALVRSAPTVTEAVDRLEALEVQAAAAVDAEIPDCDGTEVLPPVG